jgi:acyl-homoserine lactone acylase PvdQ
MTADGLPLDVRWGQVLRMKRGDSEIGAEGFSGMTANPVVAVNPAGPSNALRQMKPHVIAGRGSSWRMVVSFEPGHVRSWSILPYGNSQDPASLYYSNQMSLYAIGRYKETTFGTAAAMRASTEKISLSRE